MGCLLSKHDQLAKNHPQDQQLLEPKVPPVDAAKKTEDVRQEAPLLQKSTIDAPRAPEKSGQDTATNPAQDTAQEAVTRLSAATELTLVAYNKGSGASYTVFTSELHQASASDPLVSPEPAVEPEPEPELEPEPESAENVPQMVKGTKVLVLSKPHEAMEARVMIPNMMGGMVKVRMLEGSLSGKILVFTEDELQIEATMKKSHRESVKLNKVAAQERPVASWAVKEYKAKVREEAGPGMAGFVVPTCRIELEEFVEDVKRMCNGAVTCPCTGFEEHRVARSETSSKSCRICAHPKGQHLAPAITTLTFSEGA